MGLISILNSNPVIFVLIAIALIFALCIHEFAHGYVAYINGDDTAYRMGRLTLNPLKHLDPFGTAMILFIGFGYAKPVPVNPSNLNNPRMDIIKVAAAGPISNFILSFVSVFIYTFLLKLGILQENYTIFLQYFIIINTYLGLFNLLPIYPLDGGQIFGNFISKYNRDFFYKLNEYGPKILLGIILFSVITNISIIGWLIQTPANLIIAIFQFFANTVLFFI